MKNLPMTRSGGGPHRNARQHLMQVADQRMDNISGGIIDLDAHKVRKSLIRMYVLSTGSRSAASRVVNTRHHQDLVIYYFCTI
jgi:hypothetical protein